MAKTLPLDDIGALMAALDPARGPDPEGDAPPDCNEPRARPQGNEGGRVLRVQLGYNPNSSSLGTSVVMLLWGMGTAMVLLQAVGAALLAQGTKGLKPPSSGGPGGEAK